MNTNAFEYLINLSIRIIILKLEIETDNAYITK
jgi:hypothetical protein